METIKLVKAYKPLITKFLKVDNYDKMKSIEEELNEEKTYHA